MTGLTGDEETAIRRAADLAIAYRKSVPDRPVPPRIDVDQAMARLRHPLPEAGESGVRVIEEMATLADDGLNQMTSPGFYGYVLGGSHAIGVAADVLVSAWGQNAGSAAETPAISALERTVCDWVLDLLGLPAECGVGLVSGASVANATGVLAARNALLAREGLDVEADGLFGAPEITVLIGDAAHSAPFAALRNAGFGAGRAIRIATDSEGRIRVDAFAEALDKAEGPVLVVLQAGQINSGAFDPFDALIPLARAKGAWVHVDGAFGLWLAAVPELAPRLKGVDLADSWAVDLHKWLNAPFGAAMVICRDRAPLVAAMSARGAYLPETSENWEPSDSTPELSRRAIGVPSYAILKTLGKSGVRQLVAGHCDMARSIADRLRAEPGLSVLNEVACNQVAVRCGAGDTADAQTRAVLARVQSRGKVYPTHGVWQEGEIIRVSVIGYKTSVADTDLLVSEIVEAWRTVQRQYV